MKKMKWMYYLAAFSCMATIIFMPFGWLMLQNIALYEKLDEISGKL